MEYEIENIIQFFYLKFKSQDEEIDDDLFDDKKEINFLEYLKPNLKNKVKFDYNEFPPLKLVENDDIINSEIYQKFKLNIDNFHRENKILKDNNYENNLLDISKILIYCQENSSRLNYHISFFLKNVGTRYSKIHLDSQEKIIGIR